MKKQKENRSYGIREVRKNPENVVFQSSQKENLRKKRSKTETSVVKNRLKTEEKSNLGFTKNLSTERKYLKKQILLKYVLLYTLHILRNKIVYSGDIFN